MAGRINYPPEIIPAMESIKGTAQQLQLEMEALGRQVNVLRQNSSSGAITSFGEVQDMWNKTGFAHTEGMNSTARVGTTAYDDMIGLDNYYRTKLV
jgi:hypothetical protein